MVKKNIANIFVTYEFDIKKMKKKYLKLTGVKAADAGKKTFFFLHLFCVAFLLSFSAIAQKITISRDWKFKTGDSLLWAKPNYIDEGWDNLKVGLWWAHAGYHYGGFAWYRKKIFIPLQLRSAVEKAGYLKLELGQIQDADETFFNGTLVGATGSFSPFEGKWGDARVYLVKAGKIKWNNYNTIAVKVYGAGGNGGMHTGPYSFEPYKPSLKDSVRIGQIKLSEHDKAIIGENIFTVACSNNHTTAYAGSLSFLLKDEAGKTIKPLQRKIQIHTSDSNDFSFKCSIADESIYKITCTFTESKTGIRIRKDLIVSTIKNIKLPVADKPASAVKYKVSDVFVSAPFQAHTIEGYTGERLNINLTKRLLQVDEDELLDGYLNRPGKQNWVGEHVGKYLETACNTWLYTHNANLKKQMDRIVYVLLQTQLSNGYLGTYTAENYWTNWDVWSHKYNLIGLLAYYKATGYEPALAGATKIGNLLCKTFGTKQGQLNIILSGTHVGMASTSVLDPMVDLYTYTSDKKYLDFANYIIKSYDDADGPGIIKSLLNGVGVNKVANGKAYEMLSNLAGIVKLYKVTGEEKLLKAADNAWNDIIQNRLYITGTASSFELFTADGALPAGADANMGEGCVTTTWLQFNYQLFTLTGDLKYFTQLEKTMYNHLMGAENPQTGCVSYYTSLQDAKPFSCGITCCLSSVPRGLSMIPLLYFGKLNNNPCLLLFETGTIKDSVTTYENKRIAFGLQVISSFPDSGSVSYKVDVAGSAVFSIAVRVPFWVTHFTASVAGEMYKDYQAGFLIIKRTWKMGDEINIHFDVPIKIIDGTPSYPGKIAFQRGPYILAADQYLNKTWGEKVISSIDSGCDNAVLQSDKNVLPANWIGRQAFRVDATNGKENVAPLILVPFADAGQTGAKVRVWVSINNSKF